MANKKNPRFIRYLMYCSVCKTPLFLTDRRYRNGDVMSSSQSYRLDGTPLSSKEQVFCVCQEDSPARCILQRLNVQEVPPEPPADGSLGNSED